MSKRRRLYYRVVTFGGLGGPVRDSAEAAWEAWKRTLLRRPSPYAGRPDLLGTAYAAHNPVLIAATTRRAAEEADVSATHGRVGRGEWWRVPATGEA